MNHMEGVPHLIPCGEIEDREICRATIFVTVGLAWIYGQ